MRNHLAQYAKIDLNRAPFDWKALDRLRKIRNCIVHADGWITEDFVSRFAKVGMRVKEDTQLKLPADYFEDAWELINDTYKAVYKECTEKFGYAKQNGLAEADAEIHVGRVAGDPSRGNWGRGCRARGNDEAAIEARQETAP